MASTYLSTPVLTIRVQPPTDKHAPALSPTCSRTVSAKPGSATLKSLRMSWTLWPVTTAHRKPKSQEHVQLESLVSILVRVKFCRERGELLIICRSTVLSIALRISSYHFLFISHHTHLPESEANLLIFPVSFSYESSEYWTVCPWTCCMIPQEFRCPRCSPSWRLKHPYRWR